MIVKAGTILSQEPEGGQEIIPDETILKFEVSKGPEPIVLRDLTQYSTKGAQEYLDSVGLKFEISEEKYDDSIPKGSIISQSPPPRYRIEKG